ncbi:MAG: NUDIX hydrolase, partial [Chloroflexi bacterium]|nr:NUDIX hydrolase [Chloroflexota bacterium]
YYLVSPVEAVATLGLTSNGNILLVEQYRHPIQEVIFDLPAGSLNSGEKPIDGARREFEEETGFFPNHIELLGYYNQFPGILQAGTHLFFAKNLTPTQQNLDPGEELEVHDMPVNDLVDWILSGKTVDGSLQLAILLALKKGLII